MSSTTENSKSILESNLGQLLGFDDGVSDILDHLLSIESREDLLEYLLQLLGDSTPELINFVDNIEKHKNGESISTASAATMSSNTADDSTTKLPPPTSKKQHQSPTDYDTALMNGRQKSKSPKRSKKKSKSPPPSRQRQQQQVTNRQKQKEPPTSTSSGNKTNKVQNNKNHPMASSKNEIKNNDGDDNPPEKAQVPKSHPPKGKPKVNCGCFGMKHKPLTNCLYCGRISCVKEGYDFCPFCGYLIEQISSSNQEDKAWIQKERLLRFDREFARRTEIFDDQADFQGGPKTWMNEDEIAQAEEAEIRHLESLKHPKQTLQLDI